MTIVNSKYSVLAPRASVLHDVVVLSQAWKKAHTYIRRHNWYADTLELDCSAIDLECNLKQWSSELRLGRFQTNPAWLVPAPKNGAWGFGAAFRGNWGARPQPENQRPVLRPLAHLGIREQTVATAAMLCLADCIESAQGNTGLPPEKALSSGVFSYGNRLYCRWTEDNQRAHFPWGNATTYSQYFQDYQRFVARPNALARRVYAECGDDSTVYVVKLDLSAFYDNVDIRRLVSKLKDAYLVFQENHVAIPAAETKFWTLLRQILTFRWREEDLQQGYLFRGAALPQGLPQGLLASGFLANAYMLEFDKAIGTIAQAGKGLGEGESVSIHDYCRYVDDLRFVVTVRNSPDGEALVRKVVTEWVEAQLDLTTAPPGQSSGLKINSNKTEVETYGSIGGDAGTAARMKLLQQQLSGPFDVVTLQQVEAGLNGLMALAELGAATEDSATADDSLPPLASVARPKLEVRDDTLTRFSAYRLTRALRMRRSMTNLSEALADGGTAEDALRHDFEVTARRLVAAWSVNPSLVQVLRYAVDLFPSPQLLQPVTCALKEKLLDNGQPEDERRVAYYVLAELFRAGATETGFRASRDDAFAIGNLHRYRAELVELAQDVVRPERQAPWYVQQQAAMLLAANGQTTRSLPVTYELRFHRALHEFLDGKNLHRELPWMAKVAVSLVGFQLNGSKKGYISWFKAFANGRSIDETSNALRLIGHANQELLASIVNDEKGLEAAKNRIKSSYLGPYLESRWQASPPQLEPNEWIPFIKVITHPQGVFREENALLQLAAELARLPKSSLKQSHKLTPSSLHLRCREWTRLKDPRSNVLEVRFNPGTEEVDPAYATPSWCGKGHGWMYAFGRLLRAAATGQPDFTMRNWLMTEDVTGWYGGIRSTWQTRRVGMLHTSTALVGTTSAITPWFSELLLELLRWPGIANGTPTSKLETIESAERFAELITKRLQEQSEIYGRSSDTPAYRYPVEWPTRENRSLRVVQVQGLMPAEADLDGGLTGLDVPSYRARHRNHTAALLHLAYRHIGVRDSVLGHQMKPQVDLVIFPEFAIHVDDQDLLRAFSDATGAMLFYGLIGATAPGITGPINAARWLVPQRRSGRRSWVEVDQGKWHLTSDDQRLGVNAWRPYQVVIELRSGNEGPFRISGAVCYDATDLALAADLKDESHLFVVVAMNRDVKTFDSMVSALRYHMYQHVLITNCGEYGGSTAQAPYDREHKRVISHVHGGNQLAVTVFDICVDDFGPNLNAAAEPVEVIKPVKERLGKTPPAGLARR